MDRGRGRLSDAWRAGWGVVERVPKTTPKGAVFCRLIIGQWKGINRMPLCYNFRICSIKPTYLPCRHGWLPVSVLQDAHDFGAVMGYAPKLQLRNDT